MHDDDHVDDYQVGFLTCTATEAIDAAQAEQHKRDLEAHQQGLNPDHARQWTAWTKAEGPPSTT